MTTEDPQNRISMPGRRCRHRTVADVLREQLTDGKLVDGTGTKLPGLRQLAAELDVSVMTVRSALGILEREGLLHRIPTVGTFIRQRHPAATATQTTIALSMEDLRSPLEIDIGRSVDGACHALGWRMQMFDARSSWEVDARNHVRLPTSNSTGGIIFPVHFGESNESLFALKQAGYPFVLIDRAIAGLEVDFVESDNEGGAYQATEYLVRKGHRRILIVTDPPIVSSVISRFRGYERALIDHGIVPRPEWKVWIDLPSARRGFAQGRRNLGGYLATLFALKAMPRDQFPLGIFAHNDFVAWGIVEACRELGLGIPEDVSIVCFDDSDTIQALSPPLTCVAQRAGEIGKAAVSLLKKRLTLEGREAPAGHIQIPVDLIERASVLAVDNP